VTVAALGVRRREANVESLVAEDFTTTALDPFSSFSMRFTGERLSVFRSIIAARHLSALERDRFVKIHFVFATPRLQSCLRSRV